MPQARPSVIKIVAAPRCADLSRLGHANYAPHQLRDRALDSNVTASHRSALVQERS